MSEFDLVIKGNVVRPDEILSDAYVAISGGKIARVGQGAAPSAKEVQDFRGCWIMPGVIDGQVHAASQLNQEGLGMASRAAAAGGITTTIDMPYDDPAAISTRAAFDAKVAEARRDCHVDVALYATLLDEDNLPEAAGLIEAGACAFKFSTFEAAPGRFPRVDDDVLEKAFALIRPSGLACGVHNQIQYLTTKNVTRMREAGDTGWDAFMRAHTPLIEDMATTQVYELGARTGARAHVVHVSTDRGFEIHRMYRNAGHDVSLETCVQYLMLNHEDHAKRFGARIKHYPPICPRAEMEKLWTHIAAGNCTFVSSDHVSWGLDRKDDPDIFANKSGGPGLETLLPAFWSGCAEHGLSPLTVAKLLSEGPARHFLIDDRKGSIDVGKDADIVVLKPETYAFDPSNSQSAVQWSSFEGRTFHARVAGTWCRGEAVWDGQRIVNAAGGHDRFIRPCLGAAA